MRSPHPLSSRALLAARALGLALVACAIASSAVAAGDPVELTFAPARPVAGGLSAQGMAVADFDGDGDMDVAVMLGGQTVVQIRRYSPVAPIGSPFPADLSLDLPEIPNGIDTADFDKDGRPDLVLSAPTGLYVAFNRGLVSGSLEFDVSVRQHSNAVGVTLVYDGVRAADVDLDGFVEFVTYGVQPSESQFRQGFVLSFGNQRSDGPFGWFAPKNLAIGLPLFTDLAVGDVTGEGYPDYVLPSAELYTVMILPITGPGFTPDAPRSHLSLLTPTAVALVDLTGDGKSEIAVVGHFYASGTERLAVEILRNVPIGAGPARTFETAGLSTHAQIALPGPATFSDDIAVGDFDGDAVPDLVVTEFLNSAVTVLRLTPRLDQSGGFDGFDRLQTQIALEFESLPKLLTVADINGDGRSDILVGRQAGSHPVSLLVNTTSGTVSPTPVAPATDIKVTSALKRGLFQAGKPVKITARQPLTDAGLTLRVQTSTDPTDAGKWVDVTSEAGGVGMTPGKKPGKPWTITTTRIPMGTHWVRTVTDVPGKGPGVNVAASVTPGDAGYVGPIEVLGGGPLLVSSCTAVPTSDPAGGTTYRGDTITYILKFENLGDAAAIGAKAKARAPDRTSIDALSLGDFEAVRGTKIFWKPFNLQPYGTMSTDAIPVPLWIAFRSFKVRVDGDARVDVVFQDLDFSVGSLAAVRTAPCTSRIANPVSLLVTTGSPPVTPGDTLSYLLRATNSSSVALRHAVVTDTLPEGAGFEYAAFLDDNGSQISPPVANPTGDTNPSFDLETRVVTWYLGDVPAQTTRRLGLGVRVQYDRTSSGRIRNGVYELVGCSPDAQCDPLNFASHDLTSGEPSDVFTDLTGSPAPVTPVLRVDQIVEPDRAGRILDPNYGEIGTVLPGGTINYYFILRNSGTTAARGIRFSGTVPFGASLIESTVGADGAPHAYTFPPSRVLGLFLGDLAPGGSRVIGYSVAVPANAQPRSYIVSSGFHVRCESLGSIVQAAPTDPRVQVVTPVSFEISTQTSRVNFDFSPEAGELGKVVVLVSAWRNNGDEDGANVVITQTLPAGTHLFPDESAGVGFHEDFPETAVDVKKGKVTFRIPRVAGHASGFVRVTVRMDEELRGGADLVIATAKIDGEAANSAGKPGDPDVIAAETSAVLPVVGGSRTRVFIGRSATLTAVRGIETYYTLFFGNLGGVEAKNVTVSIDVPLGTKLFAGSTNGARVQGRRVTWNVGTMAPHSAATRQVQVGSTRTTRAARSSRTRAASTARTRRRRARCPSRRTC